MIITDLEHLIVDDYPANIEQILQFICANKTKLTNANTGNYIHENVLFNIENIHTQTWYSHLNTAIIHFIIEGDEFLEFFDIKNLEPITQKENIISYKGMKKGRVHLSQHDLAIVYPEFACQTYPHYHNKIFKKAIFFVPLS